MRQCITVKCNFEHFFLSIYYFYFLWLLGTYAVIRGILYIIFTLKNFKGKLFFVSKQAWSCRRDIYYKSPPPITKAQWVGRKLLHFIDEEIRITPFKIFSFSLSPFFACPLFHFFSSAPLPPYTAIEYCIIYPCILVQYYLWFIIFFLSGVYCVHSIYII